MKLEENFLWGIALGFIVGFLSLGVSWEFFFHVPIQDIKKIPEDTYDLSIKWKCGCFRASVGKKIYPWVWLCNDNAGHSEIIKLPKGMKCP